MISNFFGHFRLRLARNKSNSALNSYPKSKFKTFDGCLGVLRQHWNIVGAFICIRCLKFQYGTQFQGTFGLASPRDALCDVPSRNLGHLVKKFNPTMSQSCLISQIQVLRALFLRHIFACPILDFIVKYYPPSLSLFLLLSFNDERKLLIIKY